MSELWEYEDDVEDEKRHRAVWVLVVLACAAVIVVCLAVLFGKGDGSKNAANLGAADTSLAPSSPDLATQTIASTPATATPTSSTPVVTGTPGAGNPCPSAPACVVPGDGGAIAAVNAYRAAHHLPAVPGDVSDAAQTCAMLKGGGSTCVPHYAFTALASQDGTLAIGKIAQFASPWLLDPGISTMSAGWAYVDGQYECVLLKAP